MSSAAQRPLRVYLAFSARVGLAVALCSSCLIIAIQTLPGTDARLSRIEAIRLPRVVASGLGLTNEFLDALPAFVHRTFQVFSWSSFWQYALGLVASKVLFYVITAMLITLAAWFLIRLLIRSNLGPSAEQFGVAILIPLLLIPACLGLGMALPSGWPRLLKVALAAISWICVVVILVRIGTGRFYVGLRTLARVAFVLLGGIVVSGLAYSMLGPDPRFRGRVEAAPEAPNILLISIDSLRSDHLGCYGYDRDTSPNIDRLASEGIRFSRLYAPTSWTLPSHMTMLTGLPPGGHGLVDDNQRLARGVRTLPGVLQGLGYVTAGFVSGPYLHSMYGFGQGFAHYDDYSAASPNSSLSHRAITSPRVFAEVSSWLADWNETDPRAPFFLFVHLWDVHYDFMPPPPFDRKFDPEYQGSVSSENFAYSEEIHSDMNRRDLDHIVALYDGEIAYTDQYVGKMMKALESLGELDTTLVVVTSDHGEEFFEHGRKGHRKNLYGETVQVPLIARWPRQLPAGKEVAELGSLEDLSPWILALLPLNLKSSNLEPDSPLFHRYTQLRSDPMAVMRGEAFGDLHGEQGFVMAGDYKFIAEYGQAEGGELYHVFEDAAEEENLLNLYPDTANELRLKLGDWEEYWAKRGPGAESLQLDDDQMQQLKSLGYIE